MEEYEDFIEGKLREGVIPGAVFLAANDKGTFDYSQSVNAGKDPVYTPETVLEIASLTKLITTIAALQLVERGLVTLDEDVTSYIPSFAKKPILDGDIRPDGTFLCHKRRNSVTLHHLLTHTAGAAYSFTDPRIAKYTSTSPTYQADGTIDGNFNFPLSYEPGEGWLYSSSMDRVGQIIEKITGLSLDDYFRESIFRPLGISSATFKNPIHPPMAYRAHPLAPAVPDPAMPSFTTGLRDCFGGQGLLLCLPDYMKILRSLLVDDQVLLKRTTTALMFKPCLSPTTKKALLRQLENPTWTVGSLPPTAEYDWSYGGLLIDGDRHPYRQRNALLWSGAPGLYWFIDRAAGVCGVFGTQVLPPSDPAVCPVIKEFEESAYRAARSV